MKCAVYVVDSFGNARYAGLSTTEDLEATAGSAFSAPGRVCFAVPLAWHCDWTAAKVRRPLDSGTLDVSKTNTRV